VSHGPTTKLSDSRRQRRWIARGASGLPPSVERRSGAAVRSSDLVRLHFCGLEEMIWVTRKQRPV
jgi:hypothetical protein